MAESGWVGHALSVGIFEFRRSVRAIWEDKARAFLMAAGLLFPSLMLVGFLYLFASAIRGVEAVTLPPVARGTVALLWLFGVFIATQRVVSARPRIDADSLMLTTVSARTVVGGLLLAETFRLLAYLGLPVLVLTGGAVYLLGSWSSALLIPLAAVLLGLTAVLVGMALGYAVALVLATIPFVARHRTVLGGVVVLLAMGGYLLVTLPQFGGFGQDALAVLPVGWLVDLAFVGSPIHGSTTQAIGAVVGSVAVVLLGVVLVEREATRLWYTEPVRGDAGAEVASDILDGDGPRRALTDAIAPFGIPESISRPSRTVAQWSVLRTRRDPRRLNFLLLPVVMVGSVLLSSGVQAGSLWVVVAPASAVLLPWVVGALFAMNPFGDEGPVLSVTLTAIPGPAYVLGLVLPGFLFGLPLAVLVTVVAAVFGPFEPTVAIGLVGITILVTVVAVMTAPAVGMWFPRFSAIRIGQSREVIPPRLLTTALHFVGVTGPGALLALLLVYPRTARTIVAGVFGFIPAALLQLMAGDDGGLVSALSSSFQSFGTAVQSMNIEAYQLVFGGLLVLGAIVVAALAYRLAIRRFERYSPPM